MAIVGLIILQVGLVILLKDVVSSRLETNDRWRKVFGWVNANSLPLYLMHGTGMAVAIAVIYAATGYLPPAEANLEWWLTRPLWLAAPAVFTYPFLLAFKRLTGRKEAAILCDQGAGYEIGTCQFGRIMRWHKSIVPGRRHTWRSRRAR